MTRRHSFGPLELKILGLFVAGEALAAGDVQARLDAAGDDLAYTTVMTVLSRLAEKGALSRKRDGKRYLYTASARAAKLKVGVLSRIQRALFNESSLPSIAALIDEGALSASELRALRKLVDDKLKERKS